MRGKSLMKQLFDSKAAKQAANLSINSDLLMKAKGLNINLSATLEQALRERLREQARSDWVQNNKNAIDSYNASVDANGIFGEEYRSF